MKGILLLTFVAVAAASNSCSNPMGAFTLMMGEELISTYNSALDKYLPTCLKIEPPRRFIDMSKNCFFKVTNLSRKDFMKNNMRLPSRKQYVDWYVDIVDCELAELGVTVSGQEIDSNSYLDTVLGENWSADPADEAIFHGIVGQCVNNHMTGDKAVHRQVFQTESCIVDAIISNCKMMNQGMGLTMTILKAFYSLMEEPRCAGFKIPREYKVDYFAECMAEANKEWDEQGYGPYDGTLLSHDLKDQIEKGFKFFKNWGKNIMSKASECTNKKTGFSDLETGVMNHDKAISIIKELDWQNLDERDNLINAINECRQPEPTSDANKEVSAWISDNQQKWTPSNTYRFQFERCFGPKFVEICGLNNDISNWYYPLMNNEINDILMKDFIDKRGVIASNHMNTIFRDDYFEFMKLIF